MKPPKEPHKHASPKEILASFDRALQSRNLAPRTRKEYLREAQIFLERFPHPSPDDLLRHFETEATRVGPHALARKRVILMAFARHLGWDPTPLRERKVRLPRTLPRALSDPEIERIEKTAERDPDPRIPLLVYLLSRAGLRVSEVTALRYRDIDTKNGLIFVRRGKGRKDRVVPLPKAARKYVTALRRLIRDPEARIAPWSARTVQRRIHALGEAAGLGKRVTPHMLRHTTAVRLLRRGANLKVVQQILGHASLKTTEVYTKLTVEEVKEAYEKTGL